MAGFTGEGSAKPYLNDLIGQIPVYDCSTHSHHIGIVVQTGQLCAFYVGQKGAADAPNLIGGDRNANTGSAKHDTPVTFAAGNSLGGGNGEVRVIAALVCACAEILHTVP